MAEIISLKWFQILTLANGLNISSAFDTVIIIIHGENWEHVWTYQEHKNLKLAPYGAPIIERLFVLRAGWTRRVRWGERTEWPGSKSKTIKPQSRVYQIYNAGKVGWSLCEKKNGSQYHKPQLYFFARCLIIQSNQRDRIIISRVQLRDNQQQSTRIITEKLLNIKC